MEYKFGVCCCELDINNEIEKDNAITISINSSLPYELNAYMLDEMYNSNKSKKIDMDRLNIKDNPLWICPDLWIVWIRKSDNRIEQFEQLSWKTKCRLINIKE